MSNTLRRPRGGPGGDPRKLIERFGAQMLATARRYSTGSDDAEDAYQRAAEIVVKHRPTGTDDELLRWLRTTVKREALAIRRYRSRVVAFGEPEHLPEPGNGGRPAHTADAYEVAERLERLSLGAEALRSLKPQEIRALQLKAEGYSYAEICEITGWTYTKVNRCLTEGRQAFREHIARIESGSECERLAPALSSLALGEQAIADEGQVRAHLRTCLTCRVRLREHRASPTRVPALAPAGVALGEEGRLRALLDSVATTLQERWAGLTGATHERAIAMSDRLQHVTDMASAQKATAVIAASAALAGGGAVTTRDLVEDRPRHPAVQADETSSRSTAAAPDPRFAAAPSNRAQAAAPPPATAPLPSLPPSRPGIDRPQPPKASEFGPEAPGAAPVPADAPPPPDPAPPRRAEPASPPHPMGFER